jgi:cytidyltransferase-like protein
MKRVKTKVKVKLKAPQPQPQSQPQPQPPLPVPKKVFVSGCFDLLHSGHITFFEEAAAYGDLYVGIGSDKTIQELKGRKTINTEEERLYMVRALKSVKEAWINQGSGYLDFKDDLLKLNPHTLFVNDDGHNPEKKALCNELGIEYVVSRRVPYSNLPSRSSTLLRQECSIPYRIDLAGGWLDQPYVSMYYPGPVITISIEPDYEFNDRSGMSTSTRKKAIELWHADIPGGDTEKLAKILFCYENPPGSEYISGSQDALGIVLPGLNYLWYDKQQYWPSRIANQTSVEILSWLEQRIFLMALPPRENGFSVTAGNDINITKARALSEAADQLWQAVHNQDALTVGKSMTASFKAQAAMFPNMITASVEDAIIKIPDYVMGYKLSGAGGGGYLVLFSEKPVPDTLSIRIRKS